MRRKTMLSFAVFAPKGTPEDRVEFIEKGFEKVCKNKTVNKLIQKMGDKTSYLNRADFTAAMMKTQQAAIEAAKVLNK